MAETSGVVLARPYSPPALVMTPRLTCDNVMVGGAVGDVREDDEDEGEVTVDKETMEGIMDVVY